MTTDVIKTETTTRMGHQKDPSLWMILAIAQSAAWFFVLPIVCRSYWNHIFGSLSPEIAEVVLGLSAPLIYFGYAFMMLPVYYMQTPFFEQYKIQQNTPWPWSKKDSSLQVRQQFWNLTLRSIAFSTFNLFVLVPILVVLKVRIVTALGLPCASFSVTDADWPSLTDMLWQNAALSVIHEFGFYWTHRLCHVYPSLYKYHKIHHEYKMNTVLAAQHNHPVDYVWSIGGPAILATAIIRPHSFLIFQWFVWILVANMDDHVGYSFPWSPVRWFPAAASTEEHEYHHSKNVGCFGSKLDVFNKLFGGYEHYHKSNSYRKNE